MRGLTWAIILIVLFILPVLLFWIPWTKWPSTRPKLWMNRAVPSANGEKKRYGKQRRQFVPGSVDRAEELKDFFAWPGKGVEIQAPPGRRFGAFLKGRCWELYDLMSECWRSITRQGLQVGGVLSGVIILGCQVDMMRHDFTTKTVRAYYEAIYGGANDERPEDLTRTDQNCAYIPGTGIANWSDNLENLGECFEHTDRQQLTSQCGTAGTTRRWRFCASCSSLRRPSMLGWACGRRK